MWGFDSLFCMTTTMHLIPLGHGKVEWYQVDGVVWGVFTFVAIGLNNNIW